MKSFDTDIKKYTEKTHLKASERRELRERIFAYMEYHPLPKKHVDVQELSEDTILSERSIVFNFNKQYLHILSGVFAFVLVVAPFVAEHSVPGDVLYLVKTGFNENIQSTLAVTPYKKIEFETKLMERRISEARILASEGKLTPEVKTQIAKTVKEHTDAVQQGLDELREQDADGATLAQITFNSSLEVQTAMLQASASSTAEDGSVDSILVVVNDAHEKSLSDQDENEISYEGLTAQVELETTRAYELFETTKLSATAEEITDINRRLDDINRLTLEAKELHETNPDMALDDLAEILGLTQKLIAFMTDIDVRKTVDLENLVPVVLSDEERESNAREEITVMGGTLKEEVTARLALIDDVGIVEKVTMGLASIDDSLLKAAVALDVHDIALAENLVKDARALMTDIDVMTQYVENEPEVVEIAPNTGTTTPDGTEVTGSTTPEVLNGEGEE